MPPRTQQRIVVARAPEGTPRESDFALTTVDVPRIADGEFLARVVYLSLDPYLRSVMAGRHLGGAPLQPGDLMPGRSVAQVESSRHRAFEPGAYVLLESGWQQYAVSNGRDVRTLDPRAAPLSAALGVLGMPGLTAWAGVARIVRPRPGDTFVVSAAAGAVGSAAGQLARIAGCRVVGIAGGDEKCSRVVAGFGFDACVNYKADGWGEKLASHCPGGVDAYFDNVGGDVLVTVLGALANAGTVVLCGLASHYNSGTQALIPAAALIRKRARVHGLIVYDYEHEFARYLALATEWVRDGRLRFEEDRADGLAAAPAAFHRLMSGLNVGKSVVVVSKEQP